MDALTSILGRQRAEHFSETQLAEIINAHAELVNEGVRMMVRCFESSPRRTRDVVVLCILLKQFIAMQDAAVELFRKGCFPASRLQLRTAFEASIYIDWILQSRTEWRARAYQVWNLRRALKWARRARVGTPEYHEVERVFADVFEKVGRSEDEDQTYVQSEIDSVEAKLRDPRLRPLNRRCELLHAKIGHDPSWYFALFRARKNARRPSFRRICELVERLDEHHLIYETASETSHASSSPPHVEPGEDGKMLIVQIRNPLPFPEISRQFYMLVLHTHVAILKEYRPGELPRFRERWKTGWGPVLRRRISMEPEKQIHNISP